MSLYDIKLHCVAAFHVTLVSCTCVSVLTISSTLAFPEQEAKKEKQSHN